MRLILPLPPSKNSSHRQFVRGNRIQRILTETTKAYISEAQWLCKAWMLASQWDMPPPGEKVVMRVWIWWPDKRKRDPSNLIDVLADATKGVAFVDDCWLLPQIMDYSIDREHPRVEVELEQMREASKSG